MPPADNAEAWPALGGAQVATSERVQLNSWEVVTSRDDDANGGGDGNFGEGEGKEGEAAAAEAEVVGVEVEAWEMVNEDDGGEEGWEMTDASDADADAGTDLVANLDADANSDDDGAESTESSVVMVPPSTYLQALKLSTSVPEHSARLPENPCVAPARRQRADRARGRAEAMAATVAATHEGGVIDDHTAQKDTHNHATRTRKSKQSAAKRLKRLAKKAEARCR